MVFGGYKYICIVHGVYKPIYNYGAPQCHQFQCVAHSQTYPDEGFHQWGRYCTPKSSFIDGICSIINQPCLVYPPLLWQPPWMYPTYHGGDDVSHN